MVLLEILILLFVIVPVAILLWKRVYDESEKKGNQ